MPKATENMPLSEAAETCNSAKDKQDEALVPPSDDAKPVLDAYDAADARRPGN
jgi:hypothetical protein